MPRRLVVLIAAVLTFGPAIADGSTRLTARQAKRAARAYAARDPHVRCRRTGALRFRCHVTDTIQSGKLAGWQESYTVIVRRRGQWLIATSPAFAGRVRVHV